jgi:hypothetical protein
MAALSRDKYELLWSLYEQRQDARHVAKESGVGQKTVEKYIEEGDPSRGLLPLKSRLEKPQPRRSGTVDAEIERIRAETLKACRITKMVATRQLAKIAQDPDGDLKDPVKALIEVSKIEHQIDGDSVESTVRKNAFKALCDLYDCADSLLSDGLEWQATQDTPETFTFSHGTLKCVGVKDSHIEEIRQKMEAAGSLLQQLKSIETV